MNWKLIGNFEISFLKFQKISQTDSKKWNKNIFIQFSFQLRRKFLALLSTRPDHWRLNLIFISHNKPTSHRRPTKRIRPASILNLIHLTLSSLIHHKKHKRLFGLSRITFQPWPATAMVYTQFILYLLNPFRNANLPPSQLSPWTQRWSSIIVRLLLPIYLVISYGAAFSCFFVFLFFLFF